MSTTTLATVAADLAPEVLADPIGVTVEAVAAAEPTLDRTVIADSVISVAGRTGEAASLAQGLLDRRTCCGMDARLRPESWPTC